MDYNESMSTNYHQNSISRKLFGIENIINNKILTMRLIEYRIITVMIFGMIFTFFGYLMAFITLATIVDLFPQNSFIGTYNYDSTTNYQFNSLLFLVFVVFYTFILILITARIILSIDLRNAKLADTLTNKAIKIIQSVPIDSLTDHQLRELFLENEEQQFRYHDILVMIGIVIFFLMVLMIWFLIKS